ncbi:META domain-containing protein [Novosphingobium sp.]|uniref:META domain-containing protein n=1 Tax=Novosphingobium sp. TaxID=1874826 RepID=UPI0028AA1B49|nr:META domain-containing protein [Novosphingobium sp.]
MRTSFSFAAPLLGAVALTASFASLGGCTTDKAAPPAATAPSPPVALAGTSWKLVAFQSSDDAQGTTRPDEGRDYTLEFGADGALALQLDCNRGRGSYTVAPGDAGTTGGASTGGTLTIGPIASTRALCPQPDIGQMLAARLPDVASYTLRDGHLFLALKMDSGIFEFAPL